jgi:plasmid stabilization system protein ParE
VATVVYGARALADLERLFRFLLEHDQPSAVASSAAIRGAIEMLAEHPLIGRRITGDVRELVISFGRTGYIALYRLVPALEEVRILSIRHQREIGYPG